MVKEGDMITISAEMNELSKKISEEEVKERLKSWT